MTPTSLARTSLTINLLCVLIIFSFVAQTLPTAAHEPIEAAAIPTVQEKPSSTTEAVTPRVTEPSRPQAVPSS